MNRAKELENAVKGLLDMKNIRYLRIENYRCWKCGAIGNSGAKGWPDFFCYSPFLLAIECKTGKAVLSKEQKEIKELLEKSHIPYLIIRNIQQLIDNIDYLEWDKKPKRTIKRKVIG